MKTQIPASTIYYDNNTNTTTVAPLTTHPKGVDTSAQQQFAIDAANAAMEQDKKRQSLWLILCISFGVLFAGSLIGFIVVLTKKSN